ncbi:hypothetical protein ABLE92_22640 [Gordonia sp. VNQ95]|uniref:hypothetical protein n=1 Tax=Gordonia TaxID=2053 RepID=UPI0032B43537
MKHSLSRAVAVAGAVLAISIGAAPTASAYPVGPNHIEGPCKGVRPSQCPMQPSPDGLTWSFHGDAWNYDKTGRFVCMSSTFYCAPLMVVVRALPPVNIGGIIHPG